ncbi:hypothetical protein VIGAN_09211900 [Vigna angularis var. angularis]|uniref:Uncharacterized protein n=1 Tax=Vigna angularis var. angularis TaxID=157739 RepID=A0A0S3SZY7_PHAAN|nr:hypothetical protein VIGAN_09211900 [Vigna angularis var. angularis]
MSNYMVPPYASPVQITPDAIISLLKRLAKPMDLVNLATFTSTMAASQSLNDDNDNSYATIHQSIALAQAHLHVHAIFCTG